MIERYTSDRMKEVWSRQSRYSHWLEVELAVIRAWCELGVVDVGIYDEIKKRANFEVERIDEIEKSVNHEVVAFIQNVEEHIGELSRYFHFGLTSSDIMDTALALQLKEAMDLVLSACEGVLGALRKLAIKYKKTVVMGRTHGIHAEPTSFGLKMALFYNDMKCDYDRLRRATDGISYGKISGAVGNYAHISPKLEGLACSYLGLKPAPISSQVVSRERFAELMTSMAITGATLEKIAVEIRLLQRTEVGEVFEPFDRSQKGSSAMPHKKNPVLCERVCGLARLLRSYVLASFENIALWHERDISHSSVERVILPDSTTLLEYMLGRMAYILENITVDEKRMEENILITKGAVFSGGLLHKLVMKGVPRGEAHNLVQLVSFRAMDVGRELKEEVLSDGKIMSHLTEDEVEEVFDISWYIRWVDDIYERLGI
ncbi:MAG: adenylosuccinate lyase [Candidatus Coatesbacteria bacterium]|nr:MAG: adenylosuccinate lyase [Candidatus Coatesbacteria bacterium]